jgi:hypothetical protein
VDNFYNISNRPLYGPKIFQLIPHEDIKLVNWNGRDFNVRQIFEKYDTRNQHRNGLLITDVTAKDLQSSTRHRVKSAYRGDLYIRAFTAKRGLWEMTLLDTHIKQMDVSAIWFEHKGRSSLTILKKP